MTIHNSLRLYVSADTFTLEPVYNDPSVVTENVVIQRSNGELRLNAPAGRVPADEEVMTIYGVLGFIRLLAGEYMIVITDRHRVGRIGDHDIFKVKDYKIMPFSINNMALSNAQTTEEASYISLLHSHLRSGAFHFSYGYELTHTLQRQSDLRGNTLPMWERADERFFWNYRLQSKFIEHTRRHKDQNLSNFILPIVNSFVEINSVAINGKPFIFALISRRSRHRAGTRYFSRGVDVDGNVSNFNETEQIVVVESTSSGLKPSVSGNHVMVAHVQTRGSIPVFWTQINNIKYTPKLQIFENPQTENAFRKHFESQKRLYGPQLVINLINKKGYEGPMGAAFSKQIDVLSDPQIKYYHFDFHHECSKMRWHRVSLVLDHFHDDLVAQGTGNRTKVGALRDLENSIVRYFKNNFMDGARQDAYDLFLLYDVHDGGSHPLIDHRPLQFKLVPLLLVVGFAMLTACAILPESLASSHILLFASFWVAVMAYTMRFIVAHGVHYVNWPRLVPLDSDMSLRQYPSVTSEAKLGTAEVELGWKNE
ncbi:hypothetical protein BGZ99_003925 [Dissophora globulifera]|uniref:SAC domain-containing protein n=1 Tax=Dissophora globulifera TaxID=979702 RepID=A0A9P6UVR4_9FUNG|nr:hypothetical protein BGZ99_003925 [Dissophora globulifera]